MVVSASTHVLDGTMIEWLPVDFSDRYRFTCPSVVQTARGEGRIRSWKLFLAMFSFKREKFSGNGSKEKTRAEHEAAKSEKRPMCAPISITTSPGRSTDSRQYSLRNHISLKMVRSAVPGRKRNLVSFRSWYSTDGARRRPK